MFRIYIIFLLFFICSCSNKKPSNTKPLMYEPSEMTLLMRQMYEYNKVLGKEIINSDYLSQFPNDFLNIHSAVLTDSTERDSTFLLLSKKYLQLQLSIYTEKDSAKEQFNKTITSCIECHQTRCDGPIPKIRKLLIN